jgi:type VI secretion system protein ImpE
MKGVELYRDGRLGDAIAAMNEEVKAHPSDHKRRAFLAELLCLAGNLERADKQFEILSHQFSEAGPNLSLLRQLVRAAGAREQLFAEGRIPEFLHEPPPYIRLHLQASISLREGRKGEAFDLLQRAEAERPRAAGTCDGRPFDDLRDLDDLLASFFEVLTSTGKYYWIPIRQVESIEFHPPHTTLDTLWRRARMAVREGPDGEVYLPAIYPAPAEGADERSRLGRFTEWLGGEGEPVRGVGQRTFLIGDESRTIMELHELVIGDGGT